MQRIKTILIEQRVSYFVNGLHLDSAEKGDILTICDSQNPKPGEVTAEMACKLLDCCIATKRQGGDK